MTEQALPTDIHAEAFFTADHAAVESGKLYVNGGAWNQIGHPSFPAVQAFTVAAVLHIPWRAHGQNHGFGIWFEDSDGQNLGGRIEGRFEASLTPSALPGDYSVAPLAVNINGFVFQRPGDMRQYCQLTGPRSAGGVSGPFRRSTFPVRQLRLSRGGSPQPQTTQPNDAHGKRDGSHCVQCV